MQSPSGTPQCNGWVQLVSSYHLKLWPWDLCRFWQYMAFSAIHFQLRKFCGQDSKARRLKGTGLPGSAANGLRLMSACRALNILLRQLPHGLLQDHLCKILPKTQQGNCLLKELLGHEVPAASCSLVCLEVESSDEEMTRLEEKSPLSPPGELAKSLIPEFDAAIYEMETLPCADLTCPDTLLDELDFESPCEAGWFGNLFFTVSKLSVQISSWAPYVAQFFCSRSL